MDNPNLSVQDSTGKPIILSTWLAYVMDTRREDLPKLSKRSKISVRMLEKLLSGVKADYKISVFIKLRKAYGGTMFNLFQMYEREFPE